MRGRRGRGRDFFPLPARESRAGRSRSSGIPVLRIQQVAGWLADLDGIASLTAMSVSGRVVAIDPRSPERALSRLHGLNALEARTEAGVRRAMLLGL